MLPEIEVLSTVTPSPHHPLGLKGIGEAGTIASTVTVYNAVIDALAPLGVETLRMPMTAERVWRAMQDCDVRRPKLEGRCTSYGLRARESGPCTIEFDYYRAGSMAEASQLLQSAPGRQAARRRPQPDPAAEAAPGAPSALSTSAASPSSRASRVADGTVRIGAMTTHAELAASADGARARPTLAEAARQVGDPAVRNRGTIGGNVAHADPASDLPTVLSALGARFVGHRAGRNAGPSTSASFFTGMMATALGEHDLLTAIEIPAKTPVKAWPTSSSTHPASRYAVIGVAASRDREPRHLRRRGGGDWRPRAAADARVVGRTGADRTGGCPPSGSPRRPRSCPTISDPTSSATSTPRPSTARRWRRCGSGARSQRRRSAPDSQYNSQLTIYEDV